MLKEAIWPVVRRPGTWPEAVRLALSVRRRGGMGPGEDYVRWRTSTAYGSPDAEIDPDDLIALLRWRRRQRSIVR